MAKLKTKEEFIDDAKKIHGDKYDYSKVKYVNKRTKVTIICSTHGEFEQTPDAHLQGNGCIKCKYVKHAEILSGKHSFIERANKMHNNKYLYEKVNYINSLTKVIITCPIHGDFEQTPVNHITGRGCSKCAIVSTKSKTSSTTEDFIEKAKQIHGNKYDYSEVVYINNRTLIKIVCPEHGLFYQTPKKHLLGSGCKMCGYEKVGKLCRKTTEDFIKDAKQVHGDKYDYSKTQYINSKRDVEIICSIHGSFWQNPHGHVSGYGCPKCTLKEQSKIYEYIKSTFPEYNWSWEYKSQWLVNQRIDICCEEIKLAIEYNGPQHYMPIERYGGEISHVKTKERDQRKSKLCNENGFSLYVIKYDDVNYDKIREDINNIITNSKINSYEN